MLSDEIMLGDLEVSELLFTHNGILYLDEDWNDNDEVETDKDEDDMEVQEETQPSRGGARGTRQPDVPVDSMRRQTMLTWAHRKVLDATPGIDDRVLRLILRGEQLTVTSILNARSSIQVKHVITSAMKRVGLAAMARELEGVEADGREGGEAGEEQHHHQEERDNFRGDQGDQHHQSPSSSSTQAPSLPRPPSNEEQPGVGATGASRLMEYNLPGCDHG